MSIQHAIHAAPKDFINEPLVGVIKFPKNPKFGFYTALLEDGDDKINLSCNADLFSAWNGARVKLSVEGKGKGFSIQRKDDWNGHPQAGVGGNVTVSAADGDQPPAQQAAQDHSQKMQAHPPRPSKPYSKTYSSPNTTTVHKSVDSQKGLNSQELAQAWAGLAREVYGAFKEEFGEDFAIKAALQAPEWGALWWFGERSVRGQASDTAPPAHVRPPAPEVEYEEADEEGIPF